MKRLALILVLAGCQPPPTPVKPAPEPAATESGELGRCHLSCCTSKVLALQRDSGDPSIEHECCFCEDQPKPATPAFAGAVKITFVDVDEGDAILISAGDSDALIDTGSNGKWDGRLKDALESVTGPLELLFLTHAHADHYEQTDEILGLLEVNRIITNGELELHDEYRAALTAKRVGTESAVEDESYELAPGVSFEVYSTGGRHADNPDGSNINDDGLVLLLTYAGRTILFAADIEERTGKRLVADYCGAEGGSCPDLKADVLKVPHHGSADFSQEFFEQVAPSYAVISAGFHVEKHCLPRDESYQALSLLGSKIFSTSAEGIGNVSVTISSDGNMQWDHPDEPVFVWEGVRGQRCVGPLVYEQGTPKPFVEE